MTGGRRRGRKKKIGLANVNDEWTGRPVKDLEDRPPWQTFSAAVPHWIPAPHLPNTVPTGWPDGRDGLVQIKPVPVMEGMMKMDDDGWWKSKPMNCLFESWALLVSGGKNKQNKWKTDLIDLLVARGQCAVWSLLNLSLRVSGAAPAHTSRGPSRLVVLLTVIAGW